MEPRIEVGGVAVKVFDDGRIRDVVKILQVADDVVRVLGWVVLPPGRQIHHSGAFIPYPSKRSADRPETFGERSGGDASVLSRHPRRKGETPDTIALARNHVEGDELVCRVKR